MMTLDELMERDRKREADGFKRKIRIGRIVKPVRGGRDRIVVVPTTVEEKLVHDDIQDLQEGEGEPTGGTGQGEEGEVIGETPVRPDEKEGDGQGEGDGEGPGEGGGGEHEFESNAYDLGRTLSEEFDLPNLEDKGGKRTLVRYTYDMTDRHRGFGQILDKKATLRRIVETNIMLGNLSDPTDIDTARFLISPTDMIYRILSREKDYESQALVFFLRDYSGSMAGKPTQTVVSQHVMIYSWLLYQYDRQVETRFILHDTEAREVTDFYKYYAYKVAGGTQVVSAYRMVNELVEKEGLDREYNIYVFHGTDGDDWDKEGKEAVSELEKMCRYAARIGITVARHQYAGEKDTEVEKYIKASKLLEKNRERIRMDALPENAEDSRIIQGIKTLLDS